MIVIKIIANKLEEKEYFKSPISKDIMNGFDKIKDNIINNNSN